MLLTPDPIDVHVGERIRRRRKLIEQSQQQLATALGVTFQQVQKYERGANRISASMMFRAAAAQGVAPAYYFDGLETAPAEAPLTGDQQKMLTWIAGPEPMMLARFMAGLAPEFRRAVLRVAQALAERA